MKKIVMFRGGIETQEYFSLQLAKGFLSCGCEIFFYDLALSEEPDECAAFVSGYSKSAVSRREQEQNRRLRNFLSAGRSVMVTFNFHGLNGERGIYRTWEAFGSADGAGKPEEGEDRGRGAIQRPVSVWDEYRIPCYNIVLDHPLYYHDFYSRMPELYRQISIDRDHLRYMEQYYPSVTLAGFMPLAGTVYGERLRPMKERSDIVVFTGNYTPPAHFVPYITRLDDEYTAFYYSILDEMIRRPERTLEDVGREALLREMGVMSREDLRLCFKYMNFLDLYARNYYRGETVRALAEGGVRVKVYGGGWEMLEARENPRRLQENLDIGGPLTSAECLEKIGEAKLSLNVMPWFRNGAHDRIFNSMANGAVCLTDSSRYLEENLTDGKELVFYDRKSLEALPELAAKLLNDPARLEEIQRAAYVTVTKEHTWQVRAGQLLAIFNPWFSD